MLSHDEGGCKGSVYSSDPCDAHQSHQEKKMLHITLEGLFRHYNYILAFLGGHADCDGSPECLCQLVYSVCLSTLHRTVYIVVVILIYSCCTTAL